MKLLAIIDYINASIKKNALGESRFSQASLNGIANLFERERNKQLFGPYVVDDSGEGRWVGFDDTFPLQVYHKNNGATYPKPDAKQTGDRNARIYEIQNLSMMIMARRSKVKLSAEELSTLITSGLPDVVEGQTLKDFNLTGCSIYPVATNYNSIALLQTEYKGQNILFEPDMIFFELKYIIECHFKKSCINISCC